MKATMFRCGHEKTRSLQAGLSRQGRHVLYQELITSPFDSLMYILVSNRTVILVSSVSHSKRHLWRRHGFPVSFAVTLNSLPQRARSRGGVLGENADDRFRNATSFYRSRNVIDKQGHISTIPVPDIHRLLRGGVRSADLRS